MLPLTTVILFTCLQQGPDHGYCAHHRMPVHGSLRGNTFYGFFDDEADSRLEIAAIALNVEPVKVGSPYGPFRVGVECDAHCRQHFSGEWLWFCHGPELIQKDRVPYGTAKRVELHSGALPALLEKYEAEAGTKFQGASPVRHHAAKGVAMDFVPLSDKSVRVFFFVMKTRKIESWETEMGVRGEKLTDGTKGHVWKAVEDQRKPEAIESAFTEDFYVFRRQEDYFFVTESGKLYVAPAAKKGEKSRRMKPLWDDVKRPIVAVLEDANKDKVWLFATDKAKGATRELYFEMKDTIKAEPFDHAALVGVNLDSRARALLEYLPLIRKE